MEQILQKIRYKVYIQTDADGNILRCADCFTVPENLDGWLCIDEGEGEGDRYAHAQNHYFDGGVLTSDMPGIPRYRYDGSQVIQRTDEEIEADRAARPASEPTPEDVNAQAIAELSTVIAQNQSVTADAIAELTIMLAGGAL